jgi:hypothetical protein
MNERSRGGVDFIACVHVWTLKVAKFKRLEFEGL